MSIVVISKYSYAADITLNQVNNKSTLNDFEQRTITQERNNQVTQEQLQKEFDPQLSNEKKIETVDLFPVETPCLEVKHVNISSERKVSKAIKQIAKSAENLCIGDIGLNNLKRTIENKIIDLGYITSNIDHVTYDDDTSELSMNIRYGKVGKIFLSDESSKYLYLKNIFPIKKGDILNLRNVEQGLENISLIPQIEYDIKILPGEGDAESDIELNRKQDKYWQVSSWINNFGTEATGTYQGGVALFLNNVTSLNDTFYTSWFQDLHNSNDKSNKGYVASYSVPIGLWNLSFFTSDSKYVQTIDLSTLSVKYTGKSSTQSIQLGKVVSRSSSHRTAINLELMKSH